MEMGGDGVVPIPVVLGALTGCFSKQGEAKLPRSYFALGRVRLSLESVTLSWVEGKQNA